MFNKSIIKTMSACVFALFVSSANAALINLDGTIDGNQANAGAGTGSSGTGFSSLTYDDASNLLNWDVSWAGLTGNVTGMHIHGPAAAGVNGGVQVNIGAISGLTSASIGSTTISALQGADLLAGLWYVNIHTDVFGGGEVRGQLQVTPVPVPAAVWLFGSGLLGLIGLARRKA